MQKVNIRKKLEDLKEKDNSSETILEQVYQILQQRDQDQERIAHNLKGGVEIPFNTFDLDLLESENLFHISHIKEIAIAYRLRFLDIRYFKGTIPEATISKIRSLEKRHNTEIKGFKILAPSKLFKLEDKDDPVLFAPIGNDYYYLIDKWGNDLHPLRKLLMWPFKSLINLIITVVVFSYLITLLIPMGLFSKIDSAIHFWVLFVFMFNSIATIIIYFGVAKGKDFNPAIWNNKFLKT